MIITLESLIEVLKTKADPDDTSPSQALWIKLAPEKEFHERSLDYRTPDDSSLIRIYLTKQDQVVGIEIFP